MDDHISALQCTHCSYLTRNLNVLFSHCMVAHPGEPVEVRLYQCPFCEMKCSVVNFLEEHIETVHATGYNVTVNEVIRFIFNSGHHFIHRSHFNNLTNNVTTHPAAISANQSLPGSTLSQNWSTYSSNNYSQHQLACTNNTKRENWKVPEMNPNFVDLQSVRQSSNSKSKRVVKANNTWFPAPPPLSLNQQASQEHPQQQQSQPPPLTLHHQLLLTPVPTTQLNQNSNSGVMPTLTGSGPTPINSTLSDTVAALMTPRQPRLATLATPLQQLMLSSQQSLVHAGDLHHSNANIATTSQNQSGQPAAAAHYTSRMANLAQRIMIQEEANSNPQALQEKLQSILRKQAPLILRPQADTTQGMFSQASAGSNGPSSSSEIDKLLSQETSTRQLVSPTSGSTKSSQEDVLKCSQTSNGSTSSAGLTITESPDDQSNAANITENTDTEGGKASDKVVRIQCNKCPESFDNAKALFCHRHFHHEGIVTKGRKHSQHNCYSQNRLINTDRREILSGSLHGSPGSDTPKVD